MSHTNHALVVAKTIEEIGSLADLLIQENALELYRQGLEEATLKQHQDSIANFTRFLAQFPGIQEVENFWSEARAWRHVTHGIVELFREFLLHEGYSIATINSHLITIRDYCKVAHQAGFLSAQQYGLIQLVKVYNRKKGQTVDTKRPVKRRGHKKASPTSLTLEQARMLKTMNYGRVSPQTSARYRLALTLMLDHGLRVSEVCDLKLQSIQGDVLVVYRRKGKETSKIRMSEDAQHALQCYLELQKPSGYLFFGEGGKQLATRQVNLWVEKAGRRIGITPENYGQILSPHDLRHYWATNASRSGSDFKRFQQAGGWKTVHVPLGYIEDQEIANEGLKFTY